jgi:ApaG protein
VIPEYLDDQSIPEEYYYVWAYHVTIENLGIKSVTLKSRYWEIIDSNGKKQEVEGKGVIGKQPTIKPGGKFTYTSGTPLNATSGIMKGNYKMQLDDGEEFLAKIPSFSLDLPLDNKKLN